MTETNRSSKQDETRSWNSGGEGLGHGTTGSQPPILVTVNRSAQLQTLEIKISDTGLTACHLDSIPSFASPDPTRSTPNALILKLPRRQLQDVRAIATK